MILNLKLNDTAQKIMWAEAVHTCELARNSTATTCSKNNPFQIFYGDKTKMIGLFSEFGRITYVTKMGNI